MDVRQSLEQLTAELQRRGLPRAYIQRFVEELRDHMDDLNAERSPDMSTARMPEADVRRIIGDPLQLAKITAEQFHRRSFLGRHPILTFVCLPLPLMLLSLVAAMLIACLSAWAVAWGLNISIDSRPNPYVESIFVALLSWVLIIVPPMTTILLMCRVGRRNDLSWRWPVAACVVVALLCAVFRVSYKLATNDHFVPDHPGNGQLMLGIVTFWGSSIKGWLSLLLPKFTLALGLGLLLVRRAQRLATQKQPPHEMELQQAA